MSNGHSVERSPIIPKRIEFNNFYSGELIKAIEQHRPLLFRLSSNEAYGDTYLELAAARLFLETFCKKNNLQVPEIIAETDENDFGENSISSKNVFYIRDPYLDISDDERKFELIEGESVQPTASNLFQKTLRSLEMWYGRILTDEQINSVPLPQKTNLTQTIRNGPNRTYREYPLNSYNEENVKRVGNEYREKFKGEKIVTLTLTGKDEWKIFSLEHVLKIAAAIRKKYGRQVQILIVTDRADQATQLKQKGYDAYSFQEDLQKDINKLCGIFYATDTFIGMDGFWTHLALGCQTLRTNNPAEINHLAVFTNYDPEDWANIHTQVIRDPKFEEFAKQLELDQINTDIVRKAEYIMSKYFPAVLGTETYLSDKGITLARQLMMANALEEIIRRVKSEELDILQNTGRSRSGLFGLIRRIRHQNEIHHAS